jgi:hypothetical protein
LSRSDVRSALSWLRSTSVRWCGKYEDGLKLTVEVSPAVCAKLEAIMHRGSDDGACRFGLHSQDDALLTCIVPSYTERSHVHFVTVPLVGTRSLRRG